jgi:hypothetical protein
MSAVLGVGNKPNPISSVRRADGCSWNNNRPYGVTFSFQVSTHLVENKSAVPSNESINILPHDVARSDFSNNSKHFRPEVTGIVFSFSFARCAIRLTREASSEDVDSISKLREI